MIRSHTRALAAVEHWLGARGWALRRRPKSRMARLLAYADFEPDCVVNLDNRLTARSSVYMALHECGHVLIGHHRKTPKPIDKLAEEIEAWNRGRRLASRLDIAINGSFWRRLRNSCLKTYARAV